MAPWAFRIRRREGHGVIGRSRRFRLRPGPAAVVGDTTRRMGWSAAVRGPKGSWASGTAGRFRQNESSAMRASTPMVRLGRLGRAGIADIQQPGPTPPRSDPPSLRHRGIHSSHRGDQDSTNCQRPRPARGRRRDRRAPRGPRRLGERAAGACPAGPPEHRGRRRCQRSPGRDRPAPVTRRRRARCQPLRRPDPRRDVRRARRHRRARARRRAARSRDHPGAAARGRRDRGPTGSTADPVPRRRFRDPAPGLGPLDRRTGPARRAGGAVRRARPVVVAVDRDVIARDGRRLSGDRTGAAGPGRRGAPRGARRAARRGFERRACGCPAATPRDAVWPGSRCGVPRGRHPCRARRPIRRRRRRASTTRISMRSPAGSTNASAGRVRGTVSGAGSACRWP